MVSCWSPKPMLKVRILSFVQKSSYLYKMERTIRIQTGVGGYDLFEIGMEESVGIYRIKIGKKVPRILRTKKNIIKKSIAGYWYKLIKTKKTLLDFMEDEIRQKSELKDIDLNLLEQTISDFYKK